MEEAVKTLQHVRLMLNSERRADMIKNEIAELLDDCWKSLAIGIAHEEGLCPDKAEKLMNKIRCTQKRLWKEGVI